MRVKYLDQEFGATEPLSIAGSPIAVAGGVWAQFFGPLTSTQTSDWKKYPWARSLDVTIVVGAPTGTNPTLSISFRIYDPLSGVLIHSLVLTSQSIAGAAQIRFTISNGLATVWINGAATDLGAMEVPVCWGFRFTVGGATPSFPVSAVYQVR